MRPAIPYYGSKVRLSPHLPPPVCQRIIEPFAGGAGYALRWRDRDVTLIDMDEVVCGVWRYLIGASSREILALPLVSADQPLDDLAWPCDEARHLVGFWMRPCDAYPAKKPGTWAREGSASTWGVRTRSHIARLVETIRHWQVIHGDYTSAPDVRATWLVDPPYEGRVGHKYRHGSRRFDYPALARWCESRQGQVIVCEQQGAQWLPFAPLRVVRGQRGYSTEAICLLGDRAQGVLL